MGKGDFEPAILKYCIEGNGRILSLCGTQRILLWIGAIVLLLEFVAPLVLRGLKPSVPVIAANGSILIYIVLGGIAWLVPKMAWERCLKSGRLEQFVVAPFELSGLVGPFIHNGMVLASRGCNLFAAICLCAWIFYGAAATGATHAWGHAGLAAMFLRVSLWPVVEIVEASFWMNHVRTRSLWWSLVLVLTKTAGLTLFTFILSVFGLVILVIMLLVGPAALLTFVGMIPIIALALIPALGPALIWVIRRAFRFYERYHEWALNIAGEALGNFSLDFYRYFDGASHS